MHNFFKQKLKTKLHNILDHNIHDLKKLINGYNKKKKVILWDFLPLEIQSLGSYTTTTILTLNPQIYKNDWLNIKLNKIRNMFIKKSLSIWIHA